MRRTFYADPAPIAMERTFTVAEINSETFVNIEFGAVAPTSSIFTIRVSVDSQNFGPVLDVRFRPLRSNVYASALVNVASGLSTTTLQLGMPDLPLPHQMEICVSVSNSGGGNVGTDVPVRVEVIAFTDDF